MRIGHKRRRLIPIDAVEGICPLGRTLYVRRRQRVAKRAGVGAAALGTRAGRSLGQGGRTTARAGATAWRFSAPRARRATVATARATRRRWPHVRRGLVTIAEAAFFFVLAVGSLVISASIAGARLLRCCFFATRQHAPRGARAARSSAVRAGRTLAELRHTWVRRPALTEVENADLLDHPLRGEAFAMDVLADEPASPEGVPARTGLGVGAGR